MDVVHRLTTHAQTYEIRKRTKLLGNIKCDLQRLGKDIEKLDNFEDARRCKEALQTLWELFGNVLDLEV